MTALTTSGPTAVAAAAAEAALGAIDPDLAAGLREQLPRAMDVVSRRLVAAAHREGVAPQRQGVAPRRGGTIHGFDRLEVDEPLPVDPAQLLAQIAPGAGAVQAELVDAAVNLALAYARRARSEPHERTTARDLIELWADVDPDVRAVQWERLATEGHNLHPCGRTRLGWNVADLLAHDLESPATALGFVAVRRDLHVGDEIDFDLFNLAPESLDGGLDRGRFAVTPVHAWQLRHLVEGRYADLVADGALVPLEVQRPALATGALRTLLLPDRHVYVKVSLDIQVTSTRRTISVASTRNGPVLSRLLARLLPECDERVLLLPETAGSAVVTPHGDRDLAAILRVGLAGRLLPGEVAVPGSALYAVSPVTGSTVVAELVDRSQPEKEGTARAAHQWLAEYTRLLLPPLLRLATRHGIGLEAHLQNCLPTFVDGRPHRLVLRDLAGMRIFPGRLAAGHRTYLWPGSVVVADSEDVMRSKVAYTALQAHLGELVLQLGRSHGLDEQQAWADVRSVVDEVFDELAREPGLTARARADHAFLTAPTVPHKALLSMRLAATRGRGGDIYVPVRNALS